MRNTISRRLLFSLAAVIFLMQSARADYKQAAADYMKGDYQKVIQALAPELDKNPDFKDWEGGYRLLGLSYLGMKNYSMAISYLTEAVKRKSPDFATYFGLAEAYFKKQQFENCIGALNQGEAYASKDKPRLYRFRASVYFNTGKYSEALSDLTNAIRVSSAEWSDFFYLGNIYIRLGRADEGIQSLEKSLSLKAGQKDVTDLLCAAYLAKGKSYLDGKQYDPAMQYLLKAKDYDPKNGYVYFRLAEAYLFQKKYPEAEKSIIQAADLLPNDSAVYDRKGLVYEKQKKWDLALIAYKKADQINPSKTVKDSIARVTENKKIPDQGAKTK
jgi:tetratricopeptide (TPR) repeat protein